MNGWLVFVRQTTVVCVLIAIGIAVVLLSIKHRVQSLEDELGALNRRITVEREAMRILDAEIAYLTEPDRLRRLATTHLGLGPVAPQQLATFATVETALAAPPSRVKSARDGGVDGRAPVRVASRLGGRN